MQKVDGGWVLTDENIIALANYIQELQDENTRLKAQVEALQKALDEERMLTDSLLAEKDRIIELQTKQIEDVKFVYENSKPSVFDKAYLVLGGAGIAATILLLPGASIRRLPHGLVLIVLCVSVPHCCGCLVDWGIFEVLFGFARLFGGEAKREARP